MKNNIFPISQNELKHYHTALERVSNNIEISLILSYTY